MAGRTGCYPGSFNPPTVAHVALAEAAVSACDLGRVDLVVSRVALAKEAAEGPTLEDRLAVLESVVAARSTWLGLAVTDAQLLVEISAVYDVLVLGADKWQQVIDPSFYGGSTTVRDAAVSALPPLAMAARSGVAPPSHATVLELPRGVAEASSSGVRDAGRAGWMVEEAAAFDRLSGAWTDPRRYAAWRAERT